MYGSWNGMAGCPCLFFSTYTSLSIYRIHPSIYPTIVLFVCLYFFLVQRVLSHLISSQIRSRSRDRFKCYRKWLNVRIGIEVLVFVCYSCYISFGRYRRRKSRKPTELNILPPSIHIHLHPPPHNRIYKKRMSLFYLSECESLFICVYE